MIKTVTIICVQFMFFLGVLIGPLSVPSYAQSSYFIKRFGNCLISDKYKAELFRQFNELPYIATKTTNGNVIILFVNFQGDTWTLLVRNVDNPKISCFIASGDFWIDLRGIPIGDEQ